MVLGVPVDADHMNDAMAAFGLIPEQPIEHEALAIWPCIWKPLAAANRLKGQWMLTPAGHCLGFRMEAIDVVLRAMRIPAAERLPMLDDVIHLGRECARHLNTLTD